MDLHLYLYQSAEFSPQTFPTISSNTDITPTTLPTIYLSNSHFHRVYESAVVASSFPSFTILTTLTILTILTIAHSKVK